MEVYRKFSPTKVRAKRGTRPRRAIKEATNGAISISEIAAYENGDYKPSDNKMLHLLKAFGCTYNEISEPMTLDMAA